MPVFVERVVTMPHQAEILVDERPRATVLWVREDLITEAGAKSLEEELSRSPALLERIMKGVPSD